MPPFPAAKARHLCQSLDRQPWEMRRAHLRGALKDGIWIHENWVPKWCLKGVCKQVHVNHEN